MSKTNLTILDPIAYAEFLAESNREATAELKELATQQENTQAVLAEKARSIVTTNQTIPKLRPALFSNIPWAWLLLGVGIGAGVTTTAVTMMGGPA